MSHFTHFPPGAKDDPVSTDTLNGKARDVMAPILGEIRTGELIERVNALEHVAGTRELVRSYLAVG